MGSQIGAIIAKPALSYWYFFNGLDDGTKGILRL
jgi:hypothetical protein